ncbi:Hypothetical protein HDN1F_13160 [gamma proteobacterium HdN1]|nr:Hypothetical protein HDN1F_13160 [gamma proteobacterium HdN1]
MRKATSKAAQQSWFPRRSSQNPATPTQFGLGAAPSEARMIKASLRTLRVGNAFSARNVTSNGVITFPMTQLQAVQQESGTRATKR